MTGFLDSYQPVEDRLREFYERHPYGRINTELLAHHGGDYIVRATIYLGDEVGSTPPKATGLAHDSTDSLPANMKASALEVCETSAIGRALANMGLAPKGARPSREEMQKASPVPHAHAVRDAAAPVENAPLRGATGATSEGVGAVRSDSAPSDDPSEGVSGGGYGEGSTPAPPSDALAALLEAVGGSETKAINAVNKAMHTNYRKADLETLEPEDWAAGLQQARGRK